MRFWRGTGLESSPIPFVGVRVKYFTGGRARLQFLDESLVVHQMRAERDLLAIGRLDLAKGKTAAFPAWQLGHACNLFPRDLDTLPTKHTDSDEVPRSNVESPVRTPKLDKERYRDHVPGDHQRQEENYLWR